MRKDTHPNDVASSPIPILDNYYENEPQRKRFVRNLFDRTARSYDQADRLMALGSGSWYRHQALVRAGLKADMKVLDVAIGTGLVSREALKLVGNPENVIGLDPSMGMLHEARQSLSLPVLQGMGEAVPCKDNGFNFLSMGYALRHLSDLGQVFHEFIRVLEPGGIICILEITRPRGKVSLALLKFYMKGLIPLISRITTRHPDTTQLMRFYWDTIEACMPPEKVLQALAAAGFEHTKHHVELRIFSEYSARKPL